MNRDIHQFNHIRKAMRNLYYLNFCFFLTTSLLSVPAYNQNTVGLIYINADATQSGFNLLYPHNQSNVYLLNACGEIVHQWEGDPDTRPGNAVYLLEDGRLVKTLRPASVVDDPIWAGGGGATIEIRDWDNNLEWSYTLNNDTARLHHDIEIIENGNNLSILAIAWEKKDLAEVIAAGRDTSVLQDDELWPDYIFEIDPTTDEILWEWHAWDHLIQDRDSTLANFGSKASNPGRIDINYDFDGTGDPDWMHSNAIDYDPRWRQIILSVPNFHEVWIIDHTTTTAEAATNRGGLGNKGGNLMFRWGNPQAYQRGDASDQKLFYQHDAQIIQDFISPTDPLYRSYLVFNNRVSSTFSTVNTFRPTFIEYGWEFQLNPEGFAPSDFSSTITHPVDSSLLFSTILSGAQYLPNSNFLICVGRFGYTFELNPDNEIVWEYVTPLRGGQRVNQGDALSINDNLTFRMVRFPKDYPAFTDRDLSPIGTIENNPTNFPCDLTTSIANLENLDPVLLFPNPASDQVNLSLPTDFNPIRMGLYDISGKALIPNLNWQQQGEQVQIDISRVASGLYLLRIDTPNSSTSYRLIIQ